MKPSRSKTVRLGSKGGKARSEIKSLTARQNALLRWRGKRQGGVIPVDALIDGAWYSGRGRTAPVAVWDAHGQTFRTVGMNSYVDPGSFPRISERTTRLKQEGHVAAPGGSFAPLRIVGG
jgi:hypothetical protein